MRRLLLPAALAAALAGPAVAQDRPPEDELFGAPAEEKPPDAGERAPGERVPSGEGAPSEDEMFGESRAPAAQAADAAARAPTGGGFAEHLQIGGQLYLRAQVSGRDGADPGDWALTSPNLVDLWADARPNDRVRGFLLLRGSHDPTAATGGGLLPAGTPGAEQLDLERETEDVFLDQLWVNFDVGRRVFVTAGKQHVKWGVGRFWNPTDYLHPVRRDPLATFDARAGVTMLKLHLPWEQRGWNLYGVALVEDAAGDGAVSEMGGVGGGARAELVLGTAELGLDALVQRGNRPRFGVDVSAGIWELDVHAEAALRHGSDATLLRAGDSVPFESRRAEGFTPGLVGGVSWSRNYTDDDVFTVGAEYFYNDAGYEDATLYPALLAAQLSEEFRGALGLAPGRYFTPFYLGRHYAGAFLALPAPGTWNDTSFTLSALGNLSDRSWLARLDVSVLALTYLRVETYVQAHLGEKGGEFRLGGSFEGETVAAPTVDLGVALRVTL